MPSFVYTIQNNLLYVGATHLDAATCQVTYQLKILTTALFSIALLRKKISAIQWVSLFMLFVGVALVQLAQLDKPHTEVAGREQRPFVGFMAIFMACVLSGFAGKYALQTFYSSRSPFSSADTADGMENWLVVDPSERIRRCIFREDPQGR